MMRRDFRDAREVESVHFGGTSSAAFVDRFSAQLEAGHVHPIPWFPRCPQLFLSVTFGCLVCGEHHVWGIQSQIFVNWAEGRQVVQTIALIVEIDPIGRGIMQDLKGSYGC